MSTHEGFRWHLTQRGEEWIWSISDRADDTPLVSGSAETRAQAAACVVRALICGVVVGTAQPLAA